ncbi:hypothetical protein C427_1719 [Paraglaciecola psychrophila 170]|uniref:Uncharacterized protein n=1 Tax=Paraglaciecola psychrophila 170 TaxID=1129794 RepID=K7AJ42_9ALTE|nr:hypothetical protein C427_1719 [Paraglaciecola psychrophila 170]GAC40593.1 hypothetical protein GPSY_4992 [Paraglaciecola psychrophila 170]
MKNASVNQSQQELKSITSSSDIPLIQEKPNSAISENK